MVGLPQGFKVLSSLGLQEARNTPKNEIDRALKHLKTSTDHYNECVKWWKNTVDKKEYHDAEKLSKILHSEYVRLEQEKKKS